MNIEKDIVIIGAGPAGISSAIYLSRTNCSFVLLEKESFGGKLAVTTEVENYPGFTKTDGFTIASSMRKQLKELNVRAISENALNITKKDNLFYTQTDENLYISKAVIIATGSTNKKLKIKNEDKFFGHGISYCAVCDGAFFRNKEVAVFANSRKGYLEAEYLTHLVSKLYLISDRNEDDDEQNLSKLLECKNVAFLYPYDIVAYNGEDNLNSLTIRNKIDNSEKTMEVCGVFPFVGDIPSNYLVSKIGVNLDKGYVICDNAMETNIPGLFAAGDLVSKPLRQIVTACSDGAIAATSAIRYVNSLRK